MTRKKWLRRPSSSHFSRGEKGCEGVEAKSLDSEIRSATSVENALEPEAQVQLHAVLVAGGKQTRPASYLAPSSPGKFFSLLAERVRAKRERRVESLPFLIESCQYIETATEDSIT